jgi:hypothetical protein
MRCLGEVGVPGYIKRLKIDRQQTAITEVEPS